MSSYLDVGERGARIEITPSARKPIHDIPAGSNTMNYYSNKKTNKSIEKHLPGPNIDSVDEVDNIWSKPVHPSSPLQIRKLPNGSDVDAELSESDDESSSQETISESPIRKSNSYTNNSNNFEQNNYFPHHSERENSGIRDLSRQYSQETRRHSGSLLESDAPDKIPKNKRNYASYIAALVIIIIAVFYFNAYSEEKTVVQINYDRFSFYNDVKSLAQKYKVKGDSILQIQTGINTIFERQDAGSFIFLYDGGKDTFDPHKFNDFMENIASAASRYLRNATKDVQHVVLDNSKIISFKSDYDLISQFREKVDKKGVLLVKDIENVPSKLAMAFHYYCDEYNPLVKKSAIFFTLNVAECSISSSQKSTHDYIERCLKAKWKDVQKDKIGPLLTRVVNILVDVMSV